MVFLLLEILSKQFQTIDAYSHFPWLSLFEILYLLIDLFPTTHFSITRVSSFFANMLLSLSLLIPALQRWSSLFKHSPPLEFVRLMFTIDYLLRCSGLPWVCHSWVLNDWLAPIFFQPISRFCDTQLISIDVFTALFRLLVVVRMFGTILYLIFYLYIINCHIAFYLESIA